MPMSLLMINWQFCSSSQEETAKSQIASELGLSQAIVNSEVAGILAKMNAASTTEAGVRAIRENLVLW
jgi:DNA-binding NarL/FixJ family response regulator